MLLLFCPSHKFKCRSRNKSTTHPPSLRKQVETSLLHHLINQLARIIYKPVVGTTGHPSRGASARSRRRSDHAEPPTPCDHAEAMPPTPNRVWVTRCISPSLLLLLLSSCPFLPPLPQRPLALPRLASPRAARQLCAASPQILACRGAERTVRALHAAFRRLRRRRLRRLRAAQGRG